MLEVCFNCRGGATRRRRCTCAGLRPARRPAAQRQGVRRARVVPRLGRERTRRRLLREGTAVLGARIEFQTTSWRDSARPSGGSYRRRPARRFYGASSIAGILMYMPLWSRSRVPPRQPDPSCRCFSAPRARPFGNGQTTESCSPQAQRRPARTLPPPGTMSTWATPAQRPLGLSQAAPSRLDLLLGGRRPRGSGA
jgi:hypothetical protein